MKKKSKNRPAARKSEFADFLIAAASLVFIFSMIFAVSSWREEQTVYRTSKESLYYDIMEEDYASLAEVYCREYAGGAEMPEKTEAYLSVGRYYYAAMMADAADGARKAFFEEEKQKAVEKMGEFAEEAGRIDGILAANKIG